MFGIGTPELVVILIVGLIVLGPSKLPEIMRTLGKGIAEFRRMSTDVKRTLETEIDKADLESRKEEAKRELFPDGMPDEGAAPKSSQTSAQRETPLETWQPSSTAVAREQFEAKTEAEKRMADMQAEKAAEGAPEGLETGKPGKKDAAA